MLQSQPFLHPHALLLLLHSQPFLHSHALLLQQCQGAVTAVQVKQLDAAFLVLQPLQSTFFLVLFRLVNAELSKTDSGATSFTVALVSGARVTPCALNGLLHEGSTDEHHWHRRLNSGITRSRNASFCHEDVATLYFWEAAIAGLAPQVSLLAEDGICIKMTFDLFNAEFQYFL